MDSIDKSMILDVKPLKTLVPIFPNSQSGMSSPLPPLGPFPSGVQPFYPFLTPTDSRSHNATTPSGFGFNGNIPAPVPPNSFHTPIHQSSGSARPKKVSRARAVIEEDEYSGSQNQSRFSAEDTRRQRGRPKRKLAEKIPEFNFELFGDSLLTLFKLDQLDELRRSSGDKDTIGAILTVYDLLRKKLTQLEEAKYLPPGMGRRPDLKSSNLMLTKGARSNCTKRMGHLPGVEIGDIFFFRMELCMVGLHAPSMAGIDYMTMGEEPMAVSIVSSGGYDDDGDDSDVLIYSGQGGVQRRDGQMFDQKLERGNLALEKSLHHRNEVRVIRGVKDLAYPTGKIYVYDGVYKIQGSWAEKNHESGCNVFKYKLVRVPGQPECFSLWKSIQQWKDGTTSRPGLILPDLTSGAESLPVALVNNVDGEKGPPHFTYVPNSTPGFSSSEPSMGCRCLGGCQPGNAANCPCISRNEGLLPYSSMGVLFTNKHPIHECGSACSCPLDCRNRISQLGVNFRLEVFKTNNRGWGLRSWDPIRAGGFICEYAGDIIHAAENDDTYLFDASRDYEPLEPNSNVSKKSPFPLVISAKNNGNVSRFMNHGCSPNVFWQPVLRENGNGVSLHVAFFAVHHVPPMQELVYDYGMGEKQKSKCLCGSAKCRGYFC